MEGHLKIPLSFCQDNSSKSSLLSIHKYTNKQKFFILPETVAPNLAQALRKNIFDKIVNYF